MEDRGATVVVVDSLASPVRLLSTSPAAMSVRGAAAPGQQHRCTSSEDLSNKNAGRSPLSSAGSLAALLAPARGAGFTGSKGLEAGELHQLLQLAPSPQTHN